MSINRSIAVAAAAVLLSIPSVAGAVAPPTHPGNGHKPAATTPAPPTTEQGNAYGRRCQGESKKRVAGEKGTAFSRCVTALAKADSGEATSARAACAALSRKHKPGVRGTPFSRCVVAASKLIADRSAGGATL